MPSNKSFIEAKLVSRASSSFLLLVLAAGAACSSTTERAPADKNAPEAEGHDAGTDAAASVEAFDDCTCGDIPEDRTPGFGCSLPRPILVRTCIVDASCGVYAIDFEEAAPPVARHDVAIRFELAEAVPEGTDLTVNDPALAPTLDGLHLFGAKEWSVEEGPLTMRSDAKLPGKARLSADRRAVTLIPDRLEGPWVVEANFGFDAFFGPDVCGEGEGSLLGYVVRFRLP